MRRIGFVVPLLLAALGCTDDDRPGGRLQSETTALRRYDSCSALELDLEEALIREAWAYIEMRDSPIGVPAEDSGAGAGAPSNERQEGVDYSGTNNQEAGVDEADFVKTDGYYIYNVNGNRLHIFGVPQFGQLTPVSTTQLEGHPSELLIDKDLQRAVVFSWIDATALPAGHPLRAKIARDDYGGWYWRVQQVGKVTVLDISNKAAPRTDREFYFEGFYQTARRIGSSVRMASYASLNREEVWNWYSDYERLGEDGTKRLVAERIHALSLADLIPQIYVREAGGALRTDSLSGSSCRSFYRPTDSHGRGVASILSFDLASAQLAWDADHVIGNYPTFYASQDTLVLAEKAHDWWWYWWWQDDADQLNVHTFDISNPGTATYTGSGRVYGSLGDQFAIDEQDGAIRLATTTDLFWRWWLPRSERPQPENHVWVLEQRDGRVPTVGHIGDIAKGERITAARFLGDKGYLTTFRNIDPLFTVDLSDRRRPRLVGELKVPGFSTYLHPLADGTLLSVGVGGDQTGANWKTTVSLFDVSNFAAPTQRASLPLAADSGWGWSEGLWEHKAITYFAPKKVLALPQTNWSQTSVGGTPSYRYLSRLELVSVDPVAGLTRLAPIDHSAYYDADPTRYWSRVDIRRSIFMGDYVYAISDKAITAHRLSDSGLVASALLPGYQYNDWWWGGW